MLKDKHILLGVTGGIAAYKSAWLVRELKKAGADVQVVMTKAATEFVTPLTLSTLSHHKVLLDLFAQSPAETSEQWTEHVHLALWADIMVIVPASANTIAKIAHGLADNFLTTLVLALRAPLAIAPTMDVDMYRNDMTQKNISMVKESGCFVIDPDEGDLASGLSGQGRLPEIDRLVQWIDGILDNAHRDLNGKKILVSAGPTYEPIDPVRFIGNRSSGKMGFAIANAASQRGADVTLVSGPVHLRTPRNVQRRDVKTAREMTTIIEEEFPHADCVIMSAAVSDFSVARPAPQKVKKDLHSDNGLTLELSPNPDILKGLGGKKKRQVLVGFALETENEVANAKKKLSSKNLDLIVLNNPNVEGAGFDSDTNVVTVISSDGVQERLPKSSKFEVANQILDRVAPLLK